MRQKNNSVEDKTVMDKLPQNVVNCFITAGYDTIDVIKDINQITLAVKKVAAKN